MHDDHTPGNDPLHLPDPWAIKKRHRYNPVGWLDRWMTAWAKQTITDEKAYVANPTRLRRLWRWDIGTFIAVMVLILAAGVTSHDTFLHAMILPILGFIMGRALLWRLTRARAYRNGWLDGRRQMVSSMAEAVNRGLTVEQWVDGELERDVEVMRYW